MNLCLKKATVKKTIIIAFCVLIVAFFGMSFYALRTPVWQIVRAIGFLFYGILLPGYLFSRNIAEKDNSSELYAFSILFGIAISIIAYFLDECFAVRVFGIRWFSIALGLMLSIPAVFLLAKDVKEGKRTKESFYIRIPLLLLIIVAVMISFSALALLSGISAEYAETSSAYTDVLWNIGNMASLNHGWPTDDLQYYGKPLSLYVFAMIFRVICGRNIGCTMAEAFFVFSPFFLPPLIVFSLDSLGQFYIKNKTASVLYTCGFLFAGSLSRAIIGFYSLRTAYGLANKAYIITGITNLLLVPHGIDLAVPGSALLVLLILKIYKKELSIKHFWAIFVLVSIITGSKYVFVVCIGCALVGSIIIQIVQNKKDNNRIIAGICCVAVLGFCAVYFGNTLSRGVNMPATYLEAEYLAQDNEEYEQAVDTYITALNGKPYSYYCILAEDGDEETVIRQAEDGVYYACGEGLSYYELNKDEAMGLLKEAKIETGGLLNGLGGVLHKAYLNESYIALNNCCGFVRFYNWNGLDTGCMFYGKSPDVKTIPSDDSRITELFNDGIVNNPYTYSKKYSSISINALANKTELFNMLFADVSTDNAKLSLLFHLVFIPIFLFLARPITAIPFVVYMVYELKNFKRITRTNMLLFGTSITGLVAFFVLDIEGVSQAYFFMCAIIFIDLLGVQWLYNHRASIRKENIVCIGVLAVISFYSAMAVYGNSVIAGLRNMRKALAESTYENVAPPSSEHITLYEKQAMDWLRNNTPVESVIALDRHYMDPDKMKTVHPLPNSPESRWYYYSAYSERQVFLGSWAYEPRTYEMQQMLEERLKANDALFSPFCSNKKEIMEANNISYLVASQDVGFGTCLIDEELQCVYQNRDIVIYTLKT